MAGAPPPARQTRDRELSVTHQEPRVRVGTGPESAIQSPPGPMRENSRMPLAPRALSFAKVDARPSRCQAQLPSSKCIRVTIIVVKEAGELDRSTALGRALLARTPLAVALAAAAAAVVIPAALSVLGPALSLVPVLVLGLVLLLLLFLLPLCALTLALIRASFQARLALIVKLLSVFHHIHPHAIKFCFLLLLLLLLLRLPLVPAQPLRCINEHLQLTLLILHRVELALLPHVLIAPPATATARVPHRLVGVFPHGMGDSSALGDDRATILIISHMP
mmetsp:Transcript_8673/g.23857  ORF Transcript_8673/g.23857 Transcript_8673/m.23857 type:complete len:278 (+) Transcript_8673:322-1155(+)